uniref:Uncharacterized protein n=1 Tax=Anguilla anguilla TaxID=7936 RepID=A0A0E9XMA3_ANGAN
MLLLPLPQCQFIAWLLHESELDTFYSTSLWKEFKVTFYWCYKNDWISCSINIKGKCEPCDKIKKHRQKWKEIP